MGRKPGQAVLPSPTVEDAQVSGQLSLDGTPAKRLKDRVEEFCWEYCANGGNAASAYHKAYRTSNAKVSHANASRLMRDPAVQARIAEIRQDRSLQLEVLTDYLVHFLHTSLSLDRSEFINESGKLKPLQELSGGARRIVDLKTVITSQGEVTCLPEVPRRMDAAKELARILGLYNDKLQVAASVEVTPVQRIVREIVEPDQLTALEMPSKPVVE